MTYPLLNIFWTIFEVFLFVTWFWILIAVFSDIFRSSDLSGSAKAVWFVFVLFIPFIGLVTYLIIRGGEMHERAAKVAQDRAAAYDRYAAQSGASSTSTADQLHKLADLHDRNIISDQEFAQEKAKVLAA
jgi:Short C-terminal domain/Phospholipase_D-nuclease N-terminal